MKCLPKIDWKICVLAVALVASAFSVAMCFWPSHEAKRTKPSGKIIAVNKAGDKVEATKPGKKKNAVAIKTADNLPDWNDPVEDDGWVPFNDDTNAEKLLAETTREVLKEIKMAAANGKKAKCLAAVDKLLTMIASGENVPSWVKLRALDALSNFGTDSAPELVGFIADSDSDVSMVASDAFGQMLMEADGDAELAVLVKQVTAAVTDQDQLEDYMSNLLSMRNSVRVDTANAILDSGNAVAKTVLEQNFDTYFGDGDSSVQVTHEGLTQYLQENPDGSDDEFMYGPMGIGKW